MPATEYIVFAVLFSVVLVFNIAGNSLVIYIITNERGMKTSTNYLLFNLAVADLLFGVFHSPHFVIMPFFGQFVPDGVLGDWLCKLILFGNIAWIAAKVSLFTMLCLSVERYFAVCRPHTFSQRFSPKIVKVLVVVSWVYAVAVVFLPILAYIRKQQNYCFVSSSKIVKGQSFYFLLESLCSLIMMVFFLVKICISLWCKQTVEPTGEREITERKKKKKVTYCVLAVIGTFVVCWIPLYVNYMLLGFSPMIDLSATTLIALVNAALDPFLFSFQSARFKVLVKKIICCRKESW